MLQRAQHYLQRYQAWFTPQPAEHLITTMLLGAAVMFVLYWLIRGLFGFLGWLFTPEKPAPTPVLPAEPPSPLGIATQDTAEYLAELLDRFAAAHAFGGVDPAMVPLLWLLVGAVLLLFTRLIPGMVLFVGWAAATVWAVLSTTPDGNPVPAALLAGLIALLWCCWQLIAGFVTALLRAA